MPDMVPNKKTNQPDNTAVRTALWRALHVEVDTKPHIIEDEVGLQLIAPNDDWRRRPDTHQQFAKRLRASMVARARFIEVLIIEQSNQGISQYVFSVEQCYYQTERIIFYLQAGKYFFWQQHKYRKINFYTKFFLEMNIMG